MTTRRRFHIQIATALVVAFMALQANECIAQTATFLEIFGPGGGESYAQRVSADGSTIIGQADIGGGEWHATIWTVDGAVTDLGTLGGSSSNATDASDDGNVVVGYARNIQETNEAFVWTVGTGMVGLGSLDGTRTIARAVSGDGTVVVGSSNLGGFIWTAETGMVGLAYPNGQFWPIGISGDGNVVIGSAHISGGVTGAASWSSDTGFVWLGTLLGGRSSAGLDVSSDGGVVVGRITIGTSTVEAFAWTADSGMVKLDHISDYSVAQSLTDDGSMAAGTSGSKAAVWNTASGEVNELQPYLLQEYGLNTTTWDFFECFVSGDGCTLAGGGSRPDGSYNSWIVTISKAPEELLEDLILDVAVINIDNGISNQLDTKLDAAIEAFLAENADQRNDAINKLNGFINSVEAQRGKKISDAEADSLVAAAEGIIVLIE